VAKYGAIKSAIDEFSSLDVNLKARETLETKSEAYTTKLEELFRKFQETVRQI